MPEEVDPLAEYLEHLHARVRSEQGKPTARDEEEDLAILPTTLAEFCTREPRKCLDLLVRALAEPVAPELVRAIGDELLENLLNENAAKIADEVSDALRKNKRFRQAFAFGEYASVDPAVISDWVRVFQDLGTTKEAERKSVWRGAV